MQTVIYAVLLAIQLMSSKGGGSGASHDVFGTVAGIICYGQLASLTSIIVDGKAVWEGTQAQTGDSTDFTSVIDPKYFADDGYFKIYWGTSTQTIDPALNMPGYSEISAGTLIVGQIYKINNNSGSASFTGVGAADNKLGTVFTATGTTPTWGTGSLLTQFFHPDYKGLAHFVAKNFLFGREKYTAPNVEIIGTRKPVCDTSLCAAIHNIVDDGQINPVAFLGEMLTSIVGPGWAVADLDAASWADSAEYCFDNKALCFCSPLFNAQIDLRGAVAQLLAMFDGIPFRTASGTLGITPRRAGEDPGGLDTIDAALLTSKPKPSFGGWGDVPTSFIVNYSDRAHKFITIPAKKDNAIARLIRGEDHPTTVEYPHITLATQAEAMAAHLVRLNQHPPAKYQLSMRRERATGLLVGSKQKFDVDPETDSAGTTQLGTIEEIRRRRDGITEVTIKADPIAESTPYTPTINPNAQIEATCGPITDAIAIPLPKTVTGVEAGVALLVARPQADCIGVRVAWSDHDTGYESELGIQTGFAARMTLDAAVKTSGLLTVNLKYQITDNSGGASFTGVGAANNNVGTSFVATGTTPTWGTGKLITVSELIVANTGTLFSGTLRVGVRYVIENNFDTDFTPIGGPDNTSSDYNLGYSFVCTATSGITWGFGVTTLRTCTVQKADDVIRLSYADASGFDNYLAERTAETDNNAENDSLLLVLIHKGYAGSTLNHPALPRPDYDLQCEVFSIVSRTAVDSDTHDYIVLRARKDLPALDFSPSSTITEAWIVPGKDFVAWDHYKMEQAVLDGDFLVGGLNFFQLTATTAVAEDVTSPVPYAEFIFPKQQFRQPKITWSTPASDPHTLSSDSLTPAATIEDYQGDLVRVELFTTRKDTAVQTKRFDVSIPPSDSVTLADLITLSGMTAITDLAQGTTDRYYLITIRAYDSEGNVEESTITMLRLGSGTTKGFSITFSKEGRGFTGSLALTLTRNGTTASEIHYAVLKRGAPAPTSYTTVAAATVDLTLINSCRVWARSSDGTTHSQWQYQNYNKRAR